MDTNYPCFQSVTLYTMAGDIFCRLTRKEFSTKEIIYENMKVEWDIKIIGTSIGGMGVRVPGGRFYSGYVFSLRYRW